MTTSDKANTSPFLLKNNNNNKQTKNKTKQSNNKKGGGGGHTQSQNKPPSLWQATQIQLCQNSVKNSNSLIYTE